MCSLWYKKVPSSKVKQIRNNPHASLYVSSTGHWSFAVAEGKAELSEVTRKPGDAAGLAYLAEQRTPLEDEAAFLETIAAERRLFIRLRADRLYGTAAPRHRTGPIGRRP